MNNEPVIGLEIHAHVKVRTGMFCRCTSEIFGAPPNSLTCPVCLGLPGALPVPNEEAIRKTQLMGLALNSTLSKHTQFDRKNYFYPDLPKGYQLSQYENPLCVGGYLEVNKIRIRITRVHLEEDTAKSLHEGQETLLDYNKSGAALIEIVTEPDLTSAKDTVEFAKEIRNLLRSLEVSNADMEKGQLRFEANISVRKPGEKGLPEYKVEVKNINSFKFLEKAVEYEIDRQTELLKKGEQPIQENRGWDEEKQRTVSQRSKETAADYRYFPDPDIPPMEFSDEYIEELKSKLPKLPEQLSDELLQLGIRQDYVKQIVVNQDQVSFVLGLSELVKDDELNQLVGEFVNKRIETEKLSPKQFVNDFRSRKSGLVSDESQLEDWVTEVIAENSQMVSDFKSGKGNAISALMGKLMAKSKGKADPKMAMQLLQKSLK